MPYRKGIDLGTEKAKAEKAGDFGKAAQIEAERNEKIDREGLNYSKTYDYNNPTSNGIVPNARDGKSSLTGLDGGNNSIIEQQRADLIAAARAQNDSALAGLDASAAKLPGYYAGVKDNAAVTRAQTQLADNEFAAARGLNTGASANSRTANNNVYGNALSSADRSMAEQQSNINLQKQQLAAQLASTIAGINANSASAQLNQFNIDRNRQDALTAQDRANALSTLGAYSNDYMAQIQNFAKDNDPSNDWMIPYLQAARNDKMAGQQSAAAEAAQQQFENEMALARLQNSGGGGSGGGGGGTTFAQINGVVEKMYGRYYDKNYPNPDGTTGALTEAGKQAIYDYIMSYGGEYAQQLLAAYGISGGTQGGQSMPTFNGNFSAGNAPLSALDNANANTQPISMDSVTNKHSSSWVDVLGYGQLSWPELYGLVESGEIVETIVNGQVTYKKA